jgi:hypothetical protein
MTQLGRNLVLAATLVAGRTLSFFPARTVSVPLVLLQLLRAIERFIANTAHILVRVWIGHLKSPFFIVIAGEVKPQDFCPGSDESAPPRSPARAGCE